MANILYSNVVDMVDLSGLVVVTSRVRTMFTFFNSATRSSRMTHKKATAQEGFRFVGWQDDPQRPLAAYAGRPGVRRRPGRPAMGMMRRTWGPGCGRRGGALTPRRKARNRRLAWLARKRVA